jgi:DNA-directed RNA polymerase specialized sigma subunit
MADKTVKGRSSRGSKHNKAKLTEKQIPKIRAAKGTQKEIAARFGVSQQTICYIKSNKLWTHVP